MSSDSNSDTSDTSHTSAGAAAIRVVIAEDESIIRLDLKETLVDMGYEVVGDVGSGEAARDLIREKRPDLAILDIQMGPGLSGLDVAREVARDQLCAVLILTAFSQAELIDEAVDAGVMNYLVKPFQRASLKPAIDIAFARFSEVQAVRAEVAGLEEQIEVRKLVDRAKGLLMDRYQMSEQDAFAFVQKSAMHRRTAMKDIASLIISQELAPGDTEVGSPESTRMGVDRGE